MTSKATIGSMEVSMAQAAPAALPAWKSWLCTVSAVLLALLFIVAGVWKISDPLSTTARMTQALIPISLALPVALLAGIFEAWAGVLLLVPRWRRWGAWLTGLMLVAFMVYMGVFYNQLSGEDCSCFPWLKRVVGPEFFISDAAMIVLAVFAGIWSSKPQAFRRAFVILGILGVFSLSVYGVTVAQQSGLQAPKSIIVDGKPYSLQHGRIFLYFFDPECSHCFQSAQKVSKWKWANVRVIAVSTVNPQWTDYFLKNTGLLVPASSDIKPLREVFSFTDPPFAVAIEHGRQVKAFATFDDNDPESTLRAIGWLE
jgi:uncharacterized membrane protein YphA (DoxX/SURF4 family)